MIAVCSILLVTMWSGTLLRCIIDDAYHQFTDNVYHGSYVTTLTYSFDWNGTTCVYNIGQLKLIQANDIETNPGPTSLDDLMDAIKTSESKLSSQIQSIQDVIREIKVDISNVKAEQSSLRSELNSIKDSQSSHEHSLYLTDTLVEKCRDATENMRLDVDHLIKVSDQQEEKIVSMSEEIERLNRKAISNNVRVFGLNIGEKFSLNEVKSVIVNKVFKIACPSINWCNDDIKSVKVVPSDQNANSLVIVSLRHDDDKHRIYEGREQLRKQSIRVGDDLTFEQRKTLKLLKNQKGQTGYYYKGKLCIRTEDSNENASNSRMNKQAGPNITDGQCQNVDIEMDTSK